MLFLPVANVDPLNSAVVQNDPVSFRCGSSRSISCKWYHWLYKTRSIDDARLIFNGNQLSHNFKNRFRVNYSENSKSCELHINQTRVADAGIYECRIHFNNARYSAKSAHLIVLGKRVSVISLDMFMKIKILLSGQRTRCQLHTTFWPIIGSSVVACCHKKSL